ncbi:fimbrial protein [Acinetobacter sp.]|uniref:fimbrial protein n=1 Tax=Acinetobacter sp. TaxID=472 RepID=UPI003C77AB75
MKNSLLLGLWVFFVSLCTNACNESLLYNPNFYLSALGDFKTNIDNQRVATVTPDHYAELMNLCLLPGRSVFQLSGIDLSTTEVFSGQNGRIYFRVMKAQTPAAMNPAEIYIAFSVRDNQDTALLHPVNTTEPYILFEGLSSIRGMRLEDVSVIVRGTNLTPGTYTVGSIELGTFKATELFDLKPITETKTVRLLNLNYTISSSTCVINSPNITLPSMRVSDFSTENRTGGTTNFTVTANCPHDAASTLYSATITDNFSTASNSNGQLVNGISAESGGSNIQVRLSDDSNNPIPIGPLSLSNKFTFGALQNGVASKNFKASYYAESLPVTVGLLKSISMLNLIYD